MKNLYFVELTDTFGGEVNYSWVQRIICRAKSEKGAARILARETGLNFGFDGVKYVSKSGATCAFIEDYDPDSHSEYLDYLRDDRQEDEL